MAYGDNEPCNGLDKYFTFYKHSSLKMFETFYVKLENVFIYFEHFVINKNS